MPSQSRKHRGYATQALVAAALRADGWPYAESTGAGRPGADITGTPGLAIEVKARTGFEPLAALKQARTNAGDSLAIVILRMNGQGPASVDDWLAVVDFATLRRLLREAGYGTAPDDGPVAPVIPLHPRVERRKQRAA